MRHLRLILPPILLLAAIVAAAQVAAPTRASQPTTLKVVATTTQIADLARHVAGNRASVVSILPLNADAHDYEPTTDDARAVATADLLLENGLGLEKFAADLARNKRASAPLVTVTANVALRPADGHDAATVGGQDHDLADADPHVWFAAPNAAQMTRNIRDALSAVDPDGAASYAANADAYLAQLDALDRYIFEQIGTIPPAARRFVSNHDAFGYYCDRYGLTFVGSIIPSLDTEAEPSAADVARLIQAIREQQVKAIFTEAALNPALADRIARETGARVLTLYGDSLGPAGSGADTYLGMMRTNTDLIVSGLRG